MYQVWLYVEGVRLTCEDILELLERGLRRLVEDLAEAIDRTPYTVSSRQLIEGSLKLSQGLYNALKYARRECTSKHVDPEGDN